MGQSKHKQAAQTVSVQTQGTLMRPSLQKTILTGTLRKKILMLQLSALT
jgi:hypothetical protein